MKTTPGTLSTMVENPKPTARTVYALDVPLGGNRVLRCTLDAGEDAPGPLRLAIGFDEGAAWRPDRTATAGEAWLPYPARRSGRYGPRCARSCSRRRTTTPLAIDAGTPARMGTIRRKRG